MDECKETEIHLSFSAEQIQRLSQLPKEQVEYGGNIVLDDDGQVQSIEQVRGTDKSITFARRGIVHYHSHPSDANVLFQPPSAPDVVFLMVNDWLAGYARVGIVCAVEGMYIMHVQDAETLRRAPSQHNLFLLLMNWVGVYKCHGRPLWTHPESVEQYMRFCLESTGVVIRLVHWPRPNDGLQLTLRLPGAPAPLEQRSLLQEWLWRILVDTYSPETQYLTCCDISHENRDTDECIANIAKLL